MALGDDEPYKVLPLAGFWVESWVEATYPKMNPDDGWVHMVGHTDYANS